MSIRRRCCFRLARMAAAGALAGVAIAADAASAPAQTLAERLRARDASSGSVAERLMARDSVARSFARPGIRLRSAEELRRDSLVALARAQIGRRYVHGGASPERGFDCSGLVRWLMAALDVEVPRTAALQARSGHPVPRDRTALRPGDVLTFGRGPRVEHIGIYVGGGRFVHASSVAGRVIESPIDRPPAPLIKPWRGARRLVIAADTAAARRSGAGDATAASAAN
jgi:cell wall-associated NlpC family hydrolase